MEPNWETKYPDHAKGQTLWLVTGYRMDAHRKKRREEEQEPMALRFSIPEKK